MKDIAELYYQAKIISEAIDELLNDYKETKKNLTLIEDNLVEQREKLRSVKENIRTETLAQDFKSLIDEKREQQILILKEKFKK